MFRVGKEEIEAVTRVIENGCFFKINSGLQETAHCEEEMKKLFNAEYVITMTSGHAALTAALIGMGIGPGDQVIVPGYTYISTAMAVTSVGAIPVIAEIDETLTLSPEDFERKITKHTKAVIPVHIQGFPCNMDKINEIAKKHNILVLEDACQADGGTYKGTRLGLCGDAGALSFNYYKVISCGEGGALLTNNRDIFEKALIYHDSSAVAFFGDQLSDVESQLFCGNEYRTNEIASAILRVQLGRLDGIIADLRRNRDYIAEKLSAHFKLRPSNDFNGGVPTTLAIEIENADKAKEYAKAIDGGCPIFTGKHVYSNWTSILAKNGAVNPNFDPFKMEANKDIIPDYSPDMCPKTLEYLSKTIYVLIEPSWTKEEMDAIVEKAIANKHILD